MAVERGESLCIDSEGGHVEKTSEKRDSLSLLNTVEMEDSPDENTEADFDLYDDVVASFEQNRAADQRSYQEVLEELSASKNEKTTLEAQVKSLKDQNAALMQQNIALKKNISCLFKTAKIEVKRKDDELTRLRVRYETIARQKDRARPQALLSGDRGTTAINQVVSGQAITDHHDDAVTGERLPREPLDSRTAASRQGCDMAQLKAEERTKAGCGNTHQQRPALQR